MAINFDNLPKENPFAIPAKDVYKAKIADATMKQGKDASKPPYLNIKYQLTNHDGKSCGTLFDIIAESESSVVQYKIGRFLTACGIPLVGSMELADIAKLVNGKEIVIDVTHNKNAEQPRAQVDLFTREGYYPVGQFEEIYKLAHMNDGEFKEEAPKVETFINPPETADGTQTDAVEY